MLGSVFRPWGEFNWILEKLNLGKWYHIGCLSTEDRCLSSTLTLANRDLLYQSFFIEVIDPLSHLDKQIKTKINYNKNKLAKVINSIELESIDLLCDEYEIVDLVDNILSLRQTNIIIDITCFPKRFFFPMLKLLSANENVENLVVTYTKPEKYSTDDLSDDPEPWYPLPLFRSEEFPEPRYDLAFVGTGFMPFSLPKLLKDNHSQISLRLFFPFPPGPPNYQRSWEFIRKIEKHYVMKDNDEIARVNSLSVNETFDYIKAAAEDGDKKCIFAPYGPKPISLAMCMYAIKYDAPVYYTQPKFYNPEYSSGVKETFAYPVRINRHNYFY